MKAVEMSRYKYTVTEHTVYASQAPAYRPLVTIAILDPNG